jgi:hypothetical protein
MPDDIAMAVAVAVATKAADLAVSGTKNALGRLYRLIRDRFRTDPHEAAVLGAAAERPDDRERLAALAAVLNEAMATDPDFARLVRSYWGAASGEGSVVNNFSGHAEKVVQARDIGGDVHF